MKTNVRKIITTGLLVFLLLLFLVGYSRFRVSSLFWAPYANEAAVLLYHQIAPAPGGPYSITPQLFREHLDALLKNGYHVISTDELTGFLEGKATLPEKAVAITFDDGYRSFYRYAYPELKSRSLPATAFIITSWTGEKAGGFEYLSWNEMREMQANGMSFCAHTDHSHYAAPTDPDGNPKPVLTNRIWLRFWNNLYSRAKNLVFGLICTVRAKKAGEGYAFRSRSESRPRLLFDRAPARAASRPGTGREAGASVSTGTDFFTFPNGSRRTFCNLFWFKNVI
jgi:hypothetical protein